MSSCQEAASIWGWEADRLARAEMQAQRIYSENVISSLIIIYCIGRPGATVYWGGYKD